MRSFLTESIARQRALYIMSGIKYDLFLNFEKGLKYSGSCDYEFKLINKDSVFLDFTGKNLDSFRINGNNFTQNDINSIRKDGFIQIPKSELIIGENQISLFN